MKRIWALQDARANLNEMIDRSIEEGPQTITRRGRESAVVLSIADFKRLTRPKGSLLTFFRESPLVGTGLDAGRSDDTGRTVDD